jgi:membrane-bound serine protease (ClpP class)
VNLEVTISQWRCGEFVFDVFAIGPVVRVGDPGLGAGGLLAGLCAALFFWSRVLGGTSGWLEVVLFVAGVTFLLMELFVIPGWGFNGFHELCYINGTTFIFIKDVKKPI